VAQGSYQHPPLLGTKKKRNKGKRKKKKGGRGGKGRKMEVKEGMSKLKKVKQQLVWELTSLFYWQYFLLTQCRVNNAIFLAVCDNDTNAYSWLTFTRSICRWPLSIWPAADQCWCLTTNDGVTRVTSNDHRGTIFSVRGAHKRAAVIHWRTMNHCQPSTINANFTFMLHMLL